MNNRDEIISTDSALLRSQKQEEQEQLLSMLEATRNELYIFDTDSFKFSYANRSAVANTGYTVDQLHEMTPLDLIKTGFDNSSFKELLAPLLADEQQQVEFETTHRRADGTEYPVDVFLQLVEARSSRNISGNRFLAVIHDASRRKLQDQLAGVGDELGSIQEINELFRLFMRYSPVYAFIKEVSALESRVLQASDNFIDLTGIAAEDMIGKTMHQIFSADFADKILADDLHVIEAQKVLRLEEELQGKKYITYKFPIETSDGRKLLAGYSVDITDLRQTEASLRQMQSQLMQNEKMASIGQLAAGVAHEINNPIGFIGSNLKTLGNYIDKYDCYIRILEDGVRGHTDETLPEQFVDARKKMKLDYVMRDINVLLEECNEGIERVKRIVSDLGTFSRADVSERMKANLNECLESAINIVINEIKYSAELKRDYADLPAVSCNVQQVSQVFMNLLINAAHAIQDRGEEVGEIAVTSWSDGASAFVSVSDNGCGIPEERLSKIFDAFYTTRDVGKGTGLGLSISDEIIRKHGGEITVSSEPGAGSTFTVRLPVSQKIQLEGVNNE